MVHMGNKKRIAINLAKVLVFCSILLLILSGLSIVTRPKNNTEKSGTIHYQAKSVYTEPEHSIDVIAIGASNFWCGYIPMQVWKNKGYTSYNCGTLMQEIWYSYEFLEEIFKKQSPKVVLFDADVLFLEDTTTLDNINSMITTTLNWKLPVMEYHNRWKALTKEDFTTKVSATNDNMMKGFYYVLARQAYTGRDDFMNQSFDNEKLTSLIKLYFHKIQKLCEENGAKLVLVEAPSAVGWNTVRRNLVVELAREKGVDFLDANMEELGIDWENDTRDGGAHLNFYGAEKFTAYVEEYLASECELTDRRKDPEFAKWNEDLEKYLKRVNE